MIEQDPQSIMFEILSLREKINSLTMRLENIEDVAFKPLSLSIPRLFPFELGFIRSVSWLYVLYYETGRTNVDFLIGRFLAYNLDVDGKMHKHFAMIQMLRTFLQHNLDLQKNRNQQIQNSCEQWLKSQCGTPIPEDDEHWKDCLLALLRESIEFIDTLHKCVRYIERDESRALILMEWRFKRKRFHEPHEFDTLIAEVANDMGREYIDPVKLRKRYYEQWLNELDLLSGDYEFSVEARKLIEHVFLSTLISVLPITGNDIIKELGIPPGPRIGEVLRRARAIYDSDPSNRVDLIDRLRQDFPQSP